MNRDTHETLDNSDPLNTTAILFMFFKMYVTSRFDKYFLQEYGIDEFMIVPLTIPDDRVDVPEELEN